MSNVASGFHSSIDDQQEESEVSASLWEHRATEVALLRDAEAISTLLNSAYVPAEIKNKLGDVFLELTDNFNEAPEVIRTQWPLAARKLLEEDKEGASE